MKTRKLLFTGVLSLAAVKAYHAFVAFKVGTNLDVTILNPRIHKLDTTGITVRLELLLKNPTRYRMKITQPFVRVFVQGFKIASSNLANKTFTLEPLGGQQLDTIEFKIPISLKPPKRERYGDPWSMSTWWISR